MPDPYDAELERRIAKLEETVETNKVDAGEAWDRDHMRMARFEGHTMLKESREKFDIELHDLRFMIHEITRSVNDLSATIKWILISATLVLAVLMNILWKVLGG